MSIATINVITRQVLTINVTECTAPTDQSKLTFDKNNHMHIFVLQYHLVWSDSVDDRTKVV